MNDFLQFIGNINPHWWGVAMITILMLALVYTIRTSDPCYLERKMARKKERRDVADAVDECLRSLALQGKLQSPSRLNHYERLLGRALGCPDLIPQRKKLIYFPQGPINISVPYAPYVKELIRKRLAAMGVNNIAEKLSNMRRSQPSKKERVLAELRKGK